MKRRLLAEHEKELGFVPRDCVRWLSPGELTRTAVQVLLAKIFANFGDKRELQEVFRQRPLRLAEPAAEDLWIDFTADLGDGFNASYTVASLLASNRLTIGLPGDQARGTPPPDRMPAEGTRGTLTLPRGQLLILGGDEVYPSASARAYEDRMTGLYSAALPADGDLPPGNREPSLLVLPGNHDWYDGLTSFLRIFTRQRRIGAWRTIQTRSYFALQPAPGWWIVGLDSQLGEYIDEPQLDYFRNQVTSKLKPGDGIILCAAAPMWVHTKTKNPDNFNQLHFFEKNFLRNRVNPDTEELEPTGAEVRLWISGDSHHYCRYQEVPPANAGPPGGHGGGHDRGGAADPRPAQLITCGLGGAFLAETHRLPSELILPSPESRMRSKDVPGRKYVQGPASYPDAAASKAFSLRIANPFSARWVGWRNPWFGSCIGTVQLLAVGLLIWLFSITLGVSVVNALRYGVTSSALRFALIVIIVPLALVAVNILVSALLEKDSLSRWLPVMTAVVFQLAVAVLVLLAVMLVPWPRTWPNTLILALVVVLVWLLGVILGCEAFALFTLTQTKGQVASWQMSGQSIEDHKGFIRMCLRPSGDLEVYPVVVDKICRDWVLEDLRPGQKRPIPRQGLPPARLLEGPIIISRQGFPP